MALTSAEKHKAVRLLGWSGKTLVPESQSYNFTVAGYLINLSPEIEEEVREFFARFDKLEQMRMEALSRVSTKKVGDIELNTDELWFLQRERRRLMSELSDLLDIPIVATNGSVVNVCN